MGCYDARQLIRAFQMASARPSSKKFPEESEKVLDHPIELFDETLTVREVEQKYHLDRIKGYLLRLRGDGSQEAVLSAIAETNSLLGNVNESLVYARLEARDRTTH